MSFTLNQLLEFAARSGSIDKIRERVALGADPAESGALLVAVSNDHPEIVQLLLELGANPNMRDAHGHGALEYALRNRKPDIARLLINHGARLAHHSRPHWQQQLAELLKGHPV
ncbi:MAG: ankyrin repeat domain-containing protein [Azonexus sp.]|jgi:ankyrin repeat protein|uniref:ankyrin repeat domain-containing protein n=1 Tax=Azonexus sp. TaxID=1872668 RepID=UPI0028242BBD|nr:ankyrin repeat domain-containing protein [Azonexus sp.]MDR0776101.1 ankyrin repeat domain-containing protein [Azonexus sp.]